MSHDPVADAKMYKSVSQDYKAERDALRERCEWWRYMAIVGWITALLSAVS